MVPDPEAELTEIETEREWTLMFYFASDNPLAPGIVSQLKSLKNAGFHPDVNVVAQFDPHTPDTATHIFDVNRVSKLKSPKEKKIGFSGDDSYIRNLVLDKLWNGETNHENVPIKKRLADELYKQNIKYRAPKPPPYTKRADAKSGASSNGNSKLSSSRESLDETSFVELSPFESLGSFLNFCATTYPARHYMLFVIGHGLIVGNDMFLYDANAAKDSLSLANLKTLLDDFDKKAGRGEDGKRKLELLGMHSCSMSSLEVSYELQNTAKYMLASQGSAFVGSWPYREILMKIFRDQATGVNESTITKIFDYILSNSFDFQLAGYSFDMCLSRLDRDFSPLSKSMTALTTKLRAGLQNKLAKQLIIMAHWDAQSYWNESYTDLFDFCFCLSRRCKEMKEWTKGAFPIVTEMADLCDELLGHLRPSDSARIHPTNTTQAAVTNPVMDLIVRSEFAGPEGQYSHGLSVYFPWAEPIDHAFWYRTYPGYKEFEKTGWRNFLQDYFELTMREPIHSEMSDGELSSAIDPEWLQKELLEEITSKRFNVNGQLIGATLGPGDKAGGGSALAAGDKAGGGSALGPGDKAGGGSALGSGCNCATIKNYPSFTRKRRQPSNDVNSVTSPKSVPMPIS